MLSFLLPLPKRTSSMILPFRPSISQPGCLLGARAWANAEKKCGGFPPSAGHYIGYQGIDKKVGEDVARVDERVHVLDNTLVLLQDSKQLILECKSPVSPPLAPRPRPTSAVTHRVLVFGLGSAFPLLTHSLKSAVEYPHPSI